MIELQKPEPDKKECTLCLRLIKNKTVGVLIHWPSDKAEDRLYSGCEPFSFWAYLCRWCRADENKRKRIELERLHK